MQLLKEVVKPLPEWGPALPENRTGRYEEEDPLTPSVFSSGFYNFAFTTKTLGLPLAIKPHIFIPTPLSRSRTSVYIGGSRVDLRGSQQNLKASSKQGSRAGSRLDLVGSNHELRGSTQALNVITGRAPLSLPIPGVTGAVPTVVTAEMQPVGSDKNKHKVEVSPLANGDESTV